MPCAGSISCPSALEEQLRPLKDKRRAVQRAVRVSNMAAADLTGLQFSQVADWSTRTMAGGAKVAEDRPSLQPCRDPTMQFADMSGDLRSVLGEIELGIVHDELVDASKTRLGSSGYY